MTGEATVNRRKWPRQTVQLPAQYFIKNQSPKYQGCTVLNLSRNGAAVLFPAYEYLKAKGVIFLELIVPKTFQQLTLRGELKAKTRNSTGLIGGIQFLSLLREDLLNRLK
jgi:hypothetical protein